jgi:hypothetical protein
MSILTDLFEDFSKALKDKEELQNSIDTFEISIYDCTEQYNEMLDDCYDDISICGTTYCTSYALRHICPNDYRLGLEEYVRSIDINTVPSYQQMLLDLEELDDTINILSNELQEYNEYIATLGQ